MANRNQFTGNARSDPQWAADFGRGNQISPPIPAKLDPAQFVDTNGVQVIVGAAGAAANATSIPVDAIVLPHLAANVLIQGNNVVIPSGASLYFGGSKKLALTTADVKLGDTTVTVQALPTALVDNDTAYYNSSGAKGIPSGTLLGRTYAERDANTPFGLAIDTDDEIYLLLFDVIDASAPGGDDCELYRHGLTVKENYLPSWTAISGAAGLLADLRANYTCIKGVD